MSIFPRAFLYAARLRLDPVQVVGTDGRPVGERITLTEIQTRTPGTLTPRVAEVLAGAWLAGE